MTAGYNDYGWEEGGLCGRPFNGSWFMVNGEWFMVKGEILIDYPTVMTQEKRW